MSRSKPDVTLPKGVWIDLYAEAGIPVGRPISVQSKAREILIFEDSKQPDRNWRSGERLAMGERTRVLAGSVGCWAVCRSADGSAFVQELPA